MFIRPALCPVFALTPPPHSLPWHFSRAGARGCWVSSTRGPFFSLGGFVWDDHWIPSSRLLDLQSKPWLWESTGWGGGRRGRVRRGHQGHMLLIHLHTDRQTGRVTTIPNTPVPWPNLRPPPSPCPLTPADPCSHLLQGSAMCWLARGEWGEGWG